MKAEPFLSTAWPKRHFGLRVGFTLTELLCVIAILLILVTLYAGAIAKAYHRIRAFLGGLDG